ncbi:MAG: hypothetical protein JSU69_11125 [Candidatus Zixiibacteriota bacterium]|nr:MAG: hypothetical protein JSU69_11125 [candidate division Zixibacteria bacterium]
MDEKRDILVHFLAALAYRTQKALRDAPESFAAFRVRSGVRTPHELVHHMTSVLGYARTFFIGGSYRPERLPSFREEVLRFHEMLESLGNHFKSEKQLIGISPEQMIQGPLSDAMTHAGQLAMLRRLEGSGVPPENFVFADISPDNLGADQPPPVSPDKEWPEGPRGGASRSE